MDIDILQVLTLSTGIVSIIVNGVMFGRYATLLLKLKEVSSHNALLESDQVALQERFNRFQSKESMRAAREVKHSDNALEVEAIRILEASRTAPPATAGDLKAQLRSKTRGQH